MSTTRSNLIRRSLAFPVAGAVLALSASSALALPIGNGEGQPLPDPPNAAPTATLKVSPKVALVSHELQLQAKGLGDIGDIAVSNGDVVKFDASASSDPEGGALTYDFDLDGNGSYELLDKAPKQTKRYYSTGTVTVKVRVHDEGGKTDTDTDQVVVHAAPKAKISADIPVPLVGQTVNYSAYGSSDDDGITKFEWDLDGDGSYETDTGLTSTASASYQSPGARTIRLRVTDAHGVQRTASLVEKVNQLPTAAFTNGPAVVGQPVQFDGSSSTDDSAIATYEWDLDGDGTFETFGGASPTTSKTYGAAGAVNVRLRVTDDLGGQSIVARSVVVAEAQKLGTGNGAGGGGGTPQADQLAPVFTLSAKKLKLAKNGKVGVKLTCPSAEVVCKGTVKLRTTGKRPKTLATKRFTITGGTSQTVRLLLPAVQRKAIRRGAKLNAKAIIAVSDAAGNKGTQTKGILIGL